VASEGDLSDESQVLIHGSWQARRGFVGIFFDSWIVAYSKQNLTREDDG